jgi:hypothetical protein
MSPFKEAKERTAREHAQWSAEQRALLTGDRKALAAAIKTGAVFNLTKEDREALVELFGEAPPRARKIQDPEATQPLPIAEASLSAAPRQSWQEGEFAHALTKAALAWFAVICSAVILLKILAWREL